MPEMMKAQIVKAPYQMEYMEVPVPEINDDEVLIKVKVCGICGSDTSIYTGKYAKDKLPLITGHEFWGVVEKAGKNARGVKPGDRVAVDICLTCGTCYFCRHGDGLLCESFTQLGTHTNGGFAEYVKAPWKNCYQLPDDMDDFTAAFVEPLTAVVHAAQRMNAPIASSVAVIGCGLGLLHAQAAKARGCAPVIVIGTDADEKRFEIAKEMGADFVINASQTDPVEEIMKITEGVGVDNVIEAVGNPRTYEQAFKMLRRGGKLEAFGICAEDASANLEPYEFVLGEKKVSGSCAGIGNNWAEAITLLRYGVIKPQKMFSMAVPLAELQQALEELKTNKDLIKVFVCPELTERKYF
ncbi:Sorbitol dehydrogenase [uncultured Roseburia sp.]|uniref:Alcohol dehydrogenase catalytic domain-containing protein n=1 Tax=Brotonthovivens ammoniilytica TaxID=2981725 RepID=A0ABT2TKS1_9FIRM|nr:alcohol dehydrogenase catalytic domain-containing protein [Brotonthovivens ammoniilytica]MCU6762795.1 alcohol dehydrogenase catalytic domain-containing protein [Brotonthovivens ammoniilytica]SCI89209.1 Sorbitol dehydrogenase [uncultured Roseburia sp.]